MNVITSTSTDVGGNGDVIPVCVFTGNVAKVITYWLVSGFSPLPRQYHRRKAVSFRWEVTLARHLVEPRTETR